jgi:hypothetical protein
MSTFPGQTLPWPANSNFTYTPVPPNPKTTFNEEKHAVARAAMAALMTSDRGLILNQDEIVTEAWDIAEKMMAEAHKRGVYL